MHPNPVRRDYEKLTGELRISVIDDAIFSLIRVSPRDNVFQLDLFTHKWVYHADYRFQITQSSSFNNALIEHWKTQNNLDVLPKLISGTAEREFFKKRCWVLVSKEQSIGCYGFFFKMVCKLHSFANLCVICEPTEWDNITAAHNALIAAEKSPICYLDELISHFKLPAHSGFKYLNLFRLFVISDQDPVTELENKKKRTV